MIRKEGYCVKWKQEISGIGEHGEACLCHLPCGVSGIVCTYAGIYYLSSNTWNIGFVVEHFRNRLQMQQGTLSGKSEDACSGKLKRKSDF